MAAGTRPRLRLNVERYVLPKFKVAVDFAGTDNPAKHGYRPGDHVTGTVRANYFFGKPVDDAEVDRQGLRHGCGAVRSGVRRRKDGSRRRLSLRSQAADLLRRPAAQPGRGAGADRGHGERCRRPCRNSRRADHRQRIAADHHRGSGGRDAGPQSGEPGLHPDFLSRWDAGQHQRHGSTPREIPIRA